MLLTSLAMATALPLARRSWQHVLSASSATDTVDSSTGSASGFLLGSLFGSSSTTSRDAPPPLCRKRALERRRRLAAGSLSAVATGT